MSHFSRTISISSDNLGGSSAPTLLLTFDEHPMEGIYKDYFPLVWKTHTFPTEGSHKMSITYKNQLMFTNHRIENGKIVNIATPVKINLGQQTDLIEQSGSTENSFTPPRGGAGDKNIKATNKTKTTQNIGVGFDDSSTSPPPVLVFKDVKATYSVCAEITPVLSAYISLDYKESPILRGGIQTPVIWKRNLAELAETTDWVLKRDLSSGQYSITPATST